MKIIGIIISISFSLISSAQTFWTENFNNGCNSGCPGLGYTGVNGPWTNSVTGAEGITPNIWYVSCAENGMAVGACGAPCGSDATMHMSSTTVGDLGAAYDAGGLCFIGFCPRTNRRIQSPTINCTGQSGISLQFKYIENGDLLVDNATVWYFDGATWAQINDPAKTALGCGGQGIWALMTIVLPASANNNPNVRIGFRWVNNDDGVGTDPSVAIDDMILFTAVLPIELVSFVAKSKDKSIQLNWESFNERNFDGFSLERSIDGKSFIQISYIKSETQNRSSAKYEFEDTQLQNNVSYYYRLKNIDKDGSFKYSDIITAKVWSYEREIIWFYDSKNLVVKNTNEISDFHTLELLDITGKIIAKKEINFTLDANEIDAETIEKGIYFLRIGNLSENRTIKVNIW